MIVSWNWLQDYVTLDMSMDTLTDRLTMTGLNLEGTEAVGDDTAIDLEVTSNRPDCLGLIGVAREISVLFERELVIPEARPSTAADQASSVTSVEIECEDLCPRYYARIMCGVKVGPSPLWLQRRLTTMGIASINNIVDITNYVMMESAQPLHAFDLEKLNEQRIIVRRPKQGETLEAIDHNTYPLTPDMCIIADGEIPVAIGGVMGGFATEISEATTSVLIETADFSAMSIRNTARKLNLHSDSSFRFERGVDACQLDWASRRCCELIAELAGGELLEGVVVAGQPADETRDPIEFRFGQVDRLLGIEITPVESTQILTSLGLKLHGEPADNSAAFEPPSWRRDLTREVDLIEEVARVHGYDKIPDNVSVPLQLSSKSLNERVSDRVLDLLVSAGYFETVSFSFISDKLYDLFTPRGPIERIKVEHSSRKQENVMRQSLIPSLMSCRRENERRGTFGAKLFEIGSVYLSISPGDHSAEPQMVGIVGADSFAEMKGVVEMLAQSVNPESRVSIKACELEQFVEQRGAEVLLNEKPWGWLGEISRDISDRLDLRDAVVVAELSLRELEKSANLTPSYSELPKFPAVSRDFNFILDDVTTWEQLESTVTAVAGPLLDKTSFSGQYRGKQIPVGKKSYVVTVHFRSPDRTLTNDEVEVLQGSIVEACQEKLGAQLR